MAGGMAKEGLKPVVAIYSTFLQRSFDQLIHDVALQNLPVTVCIDRAGLVGDDGKTHQGIFDIAYTRIAPGMTVAAPKDENELQHMLFTAINSGKPFAVRYPRGMALGVRARREAQDPADRQGRDPLRGRVTSCCWRTARWSRWRSRPPQELVRQRHLLRRRQRPLRQAARPGPAEAGRGDARRGS